MRPRVLLALAAVLSLTEFVGGNPAAHAAVVGQSGTASAAVGATRGAVPRPVGDGEAQLVRPLDATLPIRLHLVLLPPKRAELHELARDVGDPRSPHFRQFLSFEQWKSRYAVSDQDVQAVADWASNVGLREVYRFKTNHMLIVEGSIATVQKALAVQLNEYQINGRHFFANDRLPTLPTGIASKVDNVLGLSSFERVTGVSSPRPLPEITVPRSYDGAFETISEMHADARPRSPGEERPPLAPEIGSNITGPVGGNLIEPPDLWNSQAYNFNALAQLSHCCNPTNASGGSPKETSIAIIGEERPQQSDLAQFVAAYGLASNFTEHTLSGASCCSLEITMDTEWATAMSNSFGSYLQTAHIILYEGGGTEISDDLDAWEKALENDSARIASTSDGAPESTYGSFLDLGTPSIDDFTDVTDAMAAEGWTLVAAAGDQGAYADCSNLSVIYPASDPNIVAVGGTALALGVTGGSRTLRFRSESAWTGNGCAGVNGNGGGGGGGCSGTFDKPWWQDSNGACGSSKRSLPDVSLNAGTPQVAYYLGSWNKVTGTSIGAPELAGFFAQANSYLAFIGLRGNICGHAHNAPCGPIGNPGPQLYFALNAAAHNPYYDVRDGSCNGGGPGAGYCTAAGYDQATGLGSANLLQLAWAINFYANSPGATPPKVMFVGPPKDAWYPTDQEIKFTIAGATMGVAGYTAQWDKDPGDPSSHASPGSGDPFWDGPAVPLATSGSLHLASAGRGCHTAFVRAWDNLGNVASGSYGPVCFGVLPVCTPSYPCAAPVYAPPGFVLDCPHITDFYYQAVGERRPPTPGEKPIETGVEYVGTTSLYDDHVFACTPGSSACVGFSTFKSQADWCGPAPPPPRPPPPGSCCRSCVEAGGYCTPNPPHGCICQ